MKTRRIKSLIDSGSYAPQPALVAEAMLQRAGVRRLLTEAGDATEAGGTLSPDRAGRIPLPPESRPRAA